MYLTKQLIFWQLDVIASYNPTCYVVALSTVYQVGEDAGTMELLDMEVLACHDPRLSPDLPAVSIYTWGCDQAEGTPLGDGDRRASEPTEDPGETQQGTCISVKEEESELLATVQDDDKIVCSMNVSGVENELPKTVAARKFVEKPNVGHSSGASVHGKSNSGPAVKDSSQAKDMPVRRSSAKQKVNSWIAASQQYFLNDDDKLNVNLSPLISPSGTMLDIKPLLSEIKAPQTTVFIKDGVQSKSQTMLFPIALNITPNCASTALPASELTSLGQGMQKKDVKGSNACTENSAVHVEIQSQADGGPVCRRVVKLDTESGSQRSVTSSQRTRSQKRKAQNSDQPEQKIPCTASEQTSDQPEQKIPCTASESRTSQQHATHRVDETQTVDNMEETRKAESIRKSGVKHNSDEEAERELDPWDVVAAQSDSTGGVAEAEDTPLDSDGSKGSGRWRCDRLRPLSLFIPPCSRLAGLIEDAIDGECRHTVTSLEALCDTPLSPSPLPPHLSTLSLAMQLESTFTDSLMVKRTQLQEMRDWMLKRPLDAVLAGRLAAFQRPTPIRLSKCTDNTAGRCKNDFHAALYCLMKGGPEESNGGGNMYPVPRNCTEDTVGQVFRQVRHYMQFLADKPLPCAKESSNEQTASMQDAVKKMPQQETMAETQETDMVDNVDVAETQEAETVDDKDVVSEPQVVAGKRKKSKHQKKAIEIPLEAELSEAQLDPRKRRKELHRKKSGSPVSNLDRIDANINNILNGFYDNVNTMLTVNNIPFTEDLQPVVSVIGKRIRPITDMTSRLLKDMLANGSGNLSNILDDAHVSKTPINKMCEVLENAEPSDGLYSPTKPTENEDMLGQSPFQTAFISAADDALKVSVTKSAQKTSSRKKSSKGKKKKHDRNSRGKENVEKSERRKKRHRQEDKKEKSEAHERKGREKSGRDDERMVNGDWLRKDSPEKGHRRDRYSVSLHKHRSEHHQGNRHHGTQKESGRRRDHRLSKSSTQRSSQPDLTLQPSDFVYKDSYQSKSVDAFGDTPTSNFDVFDFTVAPSSHCDNPYALTWVMMQYFLLDARGRDLQSDLKKLCPNLSMFGSRILEPENSFFWSLLLTTEACGLVDDDLGGTLTTVTETGDGQNASASPDMDLLDVMVDQSSESKRNPLKGGNRLMQAFRQAVEAKKRAKLVTDERLLPGRAMAVVKLSPQLAAKKPAPKTAKVLFKPPGVFGIVQRAAEEGVVDGDQHLTEPAMRGGAGDVNVVGFALVGNCLVDAIVQHAADTVWQELQQLWSACAPAETEEGTTPLQRLAEITHLNALSAMVTSMYTTMRATRPMHGSSTKQTEGNQIPAKQRHPVYSVNTSATVMSGVAAKAKVNVKCAVEERCLPSPKKKAKLDASKGCDEPGILVPFAYMEESEAPGPDIDTAVDSAWQLTIAKHQEHMHIEEDGISKAALMRLQRLSKTCTANQAVSTDVTSKLNTLQGKSTDSTATDQHAMCTDTTATATSHRGMTTDFMVLPTAHQGSSGDVASETTHEPMLTDAVATPTVSEVKLIDSSIAPTASVVEDSNKTRYNVTGSSIFATSESVPQLASVEEVAVCDDFVQETVHEVIEDLIERVVIACQPTREQEQAVDHVGFRPSIEGGELVAAQQAGQPTQGVGMLTQPEGLTSPQAGAPAAEDPAARKTAGRSSRLLQAFQQAVAAKKTTDGGTPTKRRAPVLNISSTFPELKRKITTDEKRGVMKISAITVGAHELGSEGGGEQSTFGQFGPTTSDQQETGDASVPMEMCDAENDEGVSTANEASADAATPMNTSTSVDAGAQSAKSAMDLDAIPLPPGLTDEPPPPLPVDSPVQPPLPAPTGSPSKPPLPAPNTSQFLPCPPLPPIFCATQQPVAPYPPPAFSSYPPDSQTTYADWYRPGQQQGSEQQDWSQWWQGDGSDGSTQQGDSWPAHWNQDGGTWQWQQDQWQQQQQQYWQQEGTHQPADWPASWPVQENANGAFSPSDTAANPSANLPWRGTTQGKRRTLLPTPTETHRHPPLLQTPQGSMMPPPASPRLQPPGTETFRPGSPGVATPCPTAGATPQVAAVAAAAAAAGDCAKSLPPASVVRVYVLNRDKVICKSIEVSPTSLTARSASFLIT